MFIYNLLKTLMRACQQNFKLKLSHNESNVFCKVFAECFGEFEQVSDETMTLISKFSDHEKIKLDPNLIEKVDYFISNLNFKVVEKL